MQTSYNFLHVWQLWNFSLFLFLYALPHLSHENSLWSEWTLRCTFRKLIPWQIFPQIGHLGQPPLSPLCIFWCKRNPFTEVKLLLHKSQKPTMFVWWTFSQCNLYISFSIYLVYGHKWQWYFLSEDCNMVRLDLMFFKWCNVSENLLCCPPSPSTKHKYQELLHQSLQSNVS